MVRLLQSITDGPHHQPELQADHLGRALEIDVASHADPEHRVGEPEAVFDCLAAGRDGVAAERGGRRDGVRPRVASNRLIQGIDAERLPAQHLGQPYAEIVGIRAARIPGDHGHVRDLVVRQLGMRRAIDG